MGIRARENESAPVAPLAYFTGESPVVAGLLHHIFRAAAYVSFGVGLIQFLSAVSSLLMLAIFHNYPGPSGYWPVGFLSLSAVAGGIIGGILCRSSWQFLRGRRGAAAMIVRMSAAWIALSVVNWLHQVGWAWQHRPASRSAMLQFVSVLFQIVPDALQSLPLVLYALLTIYIFTQAARQELHERFAS